MNFFSKLTILVFSFSIFLFPLKIWAIDFTGNANNDFPSEACTDDPSGQNIALPGTFPAGTISGFDVDQICLLYNEPDDTLFVGIVTFNLASTGLPIPFGDADGDGDPGATSAALAAEGGADFPNLADEEHFFP